MIKRLLLPLALISAAPAPVAVAPSPSEIVAAAPARDWVAIAPSDLLVMDLAADAKGKPRRVVIQLMPAPFSQGWVGNVRKLATAHWWDGTSVNRVQDNYVVQWGDASEKKALPEGLVKVGEGEYDLTLDGSLHFSPLTQRLRQQRFDKLRSDTTSAAEKTVEGVMGAFRGDSFAINTGFVSGWPIGINAKPTLAWPIHCYGMVGVGRGLPPDTGTGAELYTVIGTPPRHLDRNIALVGRVVEGIEHLSSLPRGTEALGFYKTAEERVPIVSIRIASELPAADQPHLQYLSTESATFARYADARANRRDPFFIKAAGGADICNIPVPVRRAP